MSNTTKSSFNLFHVIIVALLIANIVATLRAGRQAEQLEIMKVGGAENRAKLQTIMDHDMYKAQYAENFDLLLLQLEGDMDSMIPMFEEEFDEAYFDEEYADDDMSWDDDVNILPADEDTIDIIDDNELQG